MIALEDEAVAVPDGARFVVEGGGASVVAQCAD